MVIPGYSRYDISESGVVKDLRKNKVIKALVLRVSGFYSYRMVSIIRDDGARRSCNVLRLLALAYLEKPEELCTARPKDGDPTNTVLSNVMWVPYTEASKKAWERGKMANRQPRKSSITKEFLELLYDTLHLYDEPVTMAALSRELDVPYSTVRYSIYELIRRRKVKKTKGGYEVI